MFEDFEVRWEGVLAGDPRQVWDAVTVRAAAWIWEIDYEPRVGGAERGLTSGGGSVTAWDPPRHFQTRAQRPDGWHNELDYTLEACDGGTLLRYVHRSVLASNFDAQYDACVQHTAFYNHSLGEYVRHFAGRDAVYVELEAPGPFADYLTPSFLGLRTDDALVRVYGREAWGGGVSVALHLFAEDADPELARRTWGARLNAAEAVA